MDMGSKAKTHAKMLFVPIILALMLAIPIAGAAGLFCNTCEHPVIMLEVVGGLWPGQVNITATLLSIKAPESDSTNFLVGSIQSGKVSVDKLKEMAEVTFLKDKNLTVYYNYTDASGGTREIVLCPEQKTNATGSITCSATISQSGCGTIIVRYVSDDLALKSNPETSASHCVRGEIPFGIVVDQGACLAMFLVLGILIASLYASGKSPLATLDITTPKRPSGYGYWPGFLSSKYKIAGVAKRTAALASAVLGAKLVMDKAITKKQLFMMSTKNSLGGNYDSLVKIAVKTNLGRVNEVGMIKAKLSKLYTIAGSQNVMLGKMTQAERKKRMEIAREITSLESERNRKLSIIGQVSAALKSRLIPVDINPKTFDNIKKLSEAAKQSAALEVAKGGDATMILNAKMKERASANEKAQLAELDDLRKSIAQLKSQDKSSILIPREIFKELTLDKKTGASRSDEFLSMGGPTHPELLKGTEKEKNVRVNINELDRLIKNKEKEIDAIKGISGSQIDMFTPLLASAWKTELAERGLTKELEIENRKPADSQDSERKAFIEKSRDEMRAERQRIDELMGSIGKEISSSDKKLAEAKKIKGLANDIDELKQKVGSIREDIPSSIKEDIWQRKLDIRDHEREISKLEKKGAPEEDIRAKREVLDSEREYLTIMKNELEEERRALKATKKEYYSEYGKQILPGIPSIHGTESVVGRILETAPFSIVKFEKDKANKDLIEYERKELGVKLADSLITRGANEAIKTAGTIEAAKLRLGVDIEREGST